MELINGYDATMSTVIEELRSCSRGDRVLFSVFVFEPGESSERLIAELTSAARRGVLITLRTDISAFSWFTRWCEGTTTLIGRLQELSESMPEQVKFEPPEYPTHVKLLVFQRSSGQDVAIFGGINVGDRFRSWRDFSVRVSGKQGVDMIFHSLGWELAGSELAEPLSELQLVTNRPQHWDWFSWLARRRFSGSFDLDREMSHFFGDSSLTRYEVAASYIDDSGLELLALALSRGARVDIVLPRVPNVYKDCNARILGLLVGTWRDTGRLTVRLHPEMVHAKAAVAERQGTGELVSYIGSCNLKRRSFIQFEELNAFTEDQAFCQELSEELATLHAEAEEVYFHRELPFSSVRAMLEDYFG